MKFQLFLFLFLSVSSAIYFRSRELLNTIKWFAIFFSIIMMSCYFLLKEIDLASTPIDIETTNLTNYELNLYLIAFYEGLSPNPIVTYNGKIGPKRTKHKTFESEGVSELWLVTKNEGIFSVERSNRVMFDNQKFVVKDNQTNDSYKSKLAEKLISKFWIKRTIEYTCLVLNTILIVNLFLRKRKIHETC